MAPPPTPTKAPQCQFCLKRVEGGTLEAHYATCELAQLARKRGSLPWRAAQCARRAPGEIRALARRAPDALRELRRRAPDELRALARRAPGEVEALARRAARERLHLARRAAASCLLYTSPSPRDRTRSRMPSSA